MRAAVLRNQQRSATIYNAVHGRRPRSPLVPTCYFLFVLHRTPILRAIFISNLSRFGLALRRA
jgi:hypothetical protein